MCRSAAQFRLAVLLCALCVLAGLCLPAEAQAPSPAQTYRLAIEIGDENGAGVPNALVTLRAAQKEWRCESDFAGHCEFLAVAKLSFYMMDLPEVRVPETRALDITLAHEQEVRETVDVVESPPAIDPAKTSGTETLEQREILNVPYPTSRDIRNALPLLPGVIMDHGGEIHIAGSSRQEILNTLDGFDVSQPVAGFLEMRVNADAVRTIDAESTRYSAQYGRGDSVLAMATAIGDDKFRFAATNFLPSFQDRKGLHFNEWTPRATLSGPLKRGRVWFYEAPEVEYDLEIIKELPADQDRTTMWRTGNLAKLQANLSNANIFTAEFLVNNYHEPNASLSALTPIAATLNQHGAVYIGQLKDQHYFKSGMLLENGFAADDFSGSQSPQGDLPSVLTPEGWQGSNYAATRGSARRLQWITNAYLAPVRWHGRHEVRLGGDLDRLTYHRTYRRTPISILGEDGALARLVDFTPRSRANDNNFQKSLYIQDRWSPHDRLVIEGALRSDWDQFVERATAAPRLSGSYVVDRDGQTKLVGGAGLFYLATNLDLTSRPRTGERVDTFYAPDGGTVEETVISRFFTHPESLQAPRGLNWSLGLERELPRQVYLRMEFVQRRVDNDFLYVPVAGPEQFGGDFLLTNRRQERYQAVTATLRHSFHNVYPVLVSYTRSAARSNAVLDYSVDTIALGPQREGALPWDAPNRLLAWGWLPFIKKLDMGYAFEWRDGFPFSVVNEQQLIVGAPDSWRFPRYFTASLAMERRFRLKKMNLAVRATAEDVTGRLNPFAVNNNIDSPEFHSFTGTGHVAVTGRIRFLGRAAAGSGKATPSPQNNDTP
jgi:hypothetical protein